MSQITIFSLYVLAAVTFAGSRLPRFEPRSRGLAIAAFAFSLAGLIFHAESLYLDITAGEGFNLSLPGAVSLIGIELALIALLAAFGPAQRGVSAGMLILASAASLFTGAGGGAESTGGMAWQLHIHVMLAMSAYGLLTVGAIVALYALVQERRLRAGKLSAINNLFAPLETNERLLYGITAAGFMVLAIAVATGGIFVENLFGQHLAHKAVLSVLALIVFGVLLAGRHIAGWRGKRGIYLYLGGYTLLCLAYFGSRFVVENILGRSWG